MEIIPSTWATNWRKARSVNQTSAAFVPKVPRTTGPFSSAGATGESGTATGASVILLSSGGTGCTTPNGVQFMPYGTGADNTTGSVRVICWSRVIPDRAVDVTPNQSLFLPTVLGEFNFILSGSCPGIAGAIIGSAEIFADTITLVGATANAGTSVDIISPVNDTLANVYLDLRASIELEFSFKVGTATDLNALYRFF